MDNKEDKVCHYSGLQSVATYKSDYYYNDMLDIVIDCAHCGTEFEIEVDNIDGSVSQEECCNVCMKQNIVTYSIQDDDIIKIEVSDPDR
tara:strand:- start:414 stop:680 length:267 start_codon:yes stop_codon:yes gene_type:complete